MDVHATGYYRYWIGETIIEGLERLEVVAKFKVSGKFLRKKLTRIISIKSAVGYESYSKEEEYHNSIEKVIDDEGFLIKTIEDMVREWFIENNREKINRDRKMSLSNKSSKKDKVSVKVKV